MGTKPIKIRPIPLPHNEKKRFPSGTSDYGNCSHFCAVFSWSRTRIPPQNSPIFRNLAPPASPARPSTALMRKTGQPLARAIVATAKKAVVAGERDGSDATRREAGARRDILGSARLRGMRGTTARVPSRHQLPPSAPPGIRGLSCFSRLALPFSPAPGPPFSPPRLSPSARLLAPFLPSSRPEGVPSRRRGLFSCEITEVTAH